MIGTVRRREIFDRHTATIRGQSVQGKILLRSGMATVRRSHQEPMYRNLTEVLRRILSRTQTAVIIPYIPIDAAKPLGMTIRSMQAISAIRVRHLQAAGTSEHRVLSIIRETSAYRLTRAEISTAPPASRPRYDDARPPAGPRTDRPADLPASVHATKAGPPTGPHSDTSRGHHDSNAYRQTESQYGRLNNNPEAPSGPRLPNGNAGPARGPRSGLAIQSQVNMPAPANPSSMQSSNFSNRPTPSGPALNRPTRNTNPFGRPPPASSSAPTTPASEAPDTAGVHPERLKAIQSSNDDSAVGAGRIAPPNAPNPRGPAAQPSAAPTPPSRPQAAAPASGPAAPRERADRRFTGLNTVLQQASVTSGPDRPGGPGANLRPRATRANGSSPIASAPPRRDPPNDSPSYPPARSDAPGPGPLNLPPPRPDLFAGRAASAAYPPKAAPDDDRGRGSDRELRSTRPRDHRSLSPSRRGPGGPPPPPSAGPSSGAGYPPRDDLRPPPPRDDLRPPPPRDDLRPPPPRSRAAAEDPRDHRAPPRNFSGPPGVADRDGRRGLRERDEGPGLAKDRERRDAGMERRDGGGGWPAERHGPDRRERERRDEYELSGPGRKRVRGPDEGVRAGEEEPAWPLSKVQGSCWCFCGLISFHVLCFLFTQVQRAHHLPAWLQEREGGPVALCTELGRAADSMTAFALRAPGDAAARIDSPLVYDDCCDTVCSDGCAQVVLAADAAESKPLFDFTKLPNVQSFASCSVCCNENIAFLPVVS